MSGRDAIRRLVLVAAAILLVGLAAEWLAHGTRWSFEAQRDLLTGWLIAGCGLLSWARVPHSRIGPLLIIAGLTWFIGTTADPLTPTGRVAQALTEVYAGVLAHALVTWPSGRATRPMERALVVAGYGVVLLWAAWPNLPSTLLVGGLLAAGLLAQAATLTPHVRRVRRPALLLGLGLAVMLAAKGVLASALREAGIAYPGGAGDIWQMALVAVAVGLTWSLIALERRRRSATDLVVELGDDRPALSVAEMAEAAGLADDAAIADALAQAAAMAERNAILRDELSAQAAGLEASRRRLVEAGDAERAALETRLRLGAADRLGRLQTGLRLERDRVVSLAPELRPGLDRALDQLTRAQVELDELSAGLDPALLRERGLRAALLDLAERSPVPVSLTIEATVLGEPGVERTLFYVASEALANVAKHARATRSWLHLGEDPVVLTLTVEDDGVGIVGLREGSGLRGLRDRIDALGGSLVVSRGDAGGARLLVTIPTAAPRQRG
jgi:signal transduction histidine kinase